MKISTFQSIIVLFTLAGLFIAPSSAQASQQQQSQRRLVAASIGRNRLPAVQTSYSSRTMTSGVGVSSGSANASGYLRNSLPPTRLDSFVLNAGGHAEHIYGDEGADGIPPYFGFNTVHRINTGIVGDRDAGLTTGHGSYMPDAFGADEFIAPPGEWSQSGANGGNHNYNNAAAALDAAANAQSHSGGGGGQGGISEGDLAAHPSPGEGYQPMFQHGIFVGWWSPAEIALSQTDFPAALRSIIHSDRFWGDAFSIEVEIGDRSWP